MDTKKLMAWCEENGFDVEIKRSENKEFYYDYPSATIYCGKENPKEEKIWFSFVEKLGLKHIDVPIDVQAFLHELGHFETIDDMGDEDWEELTLFSLIKNDKSLSIDDITLAYYNLNIERVATEWMVNYINNNLATVQKLYKIFK